METERSELEALVDVVDSVEGWLSRDQAALLLRLASEVPAHEAIVEIGNYRGRSTVALGLGAERGGATVFSIDPHDEFVGARGGRFGPRDQAQLYANLVRAGVGARVRVICLASEQVASSWRKRDVRLLFLDGDHRYEAVRNDYESWERHLVRDAEVLFDDCDFADVGRLVSELVAAGRLREIERVGKVARCRRPGNRMLIEVQGA